MNYCEKCMRPLEEGKFCSACGILTAAPLHHIKPGTILRKKYMVGRAVREDSMVISYICRDISCDQVVILQEFFPEGQVVRNHLQDNTVAEAHFQEKALERFLEKAAVLADCGETPCIQQVRDYFRDNNTAYMVMEKPTGITIERYLEKKGKIPAETLLQLMEPTLQTLCELHEKGVLHRRLNPENILLYPDGTIKLVEFGISDAAADISCYTAPEQNEGPWSDVYALCATLYKSVTGEDPQMAVERILSDELLPPSALGVALEEHTEAALMMGLALNKEMRLMSVRALMRAMQLTLPAEPEDPVVFCQEPEQEQMAFTGMPVLEEASEQEEKLIDPVEQHGKVPTYTAPLVDVRQEEAPLSEPRFEEVPQIEFEDETVPEFEEALLAELVEMPIPEFKEEPLPEFEEAPLPGFEEEPQVVENIDNDVTQIFEPQPDAWQTEPEDPWGYSEEPLFDEQPRNKKKIGRIAIACVAAAVVIAGLIGLFFFLKEKGVFGGEEETAVYTVVEEPVEQIEL